MGKPEINDNTQKILVKKEKRTGESYMSPHERTFGNKSNMTDTNSSINLISFKNETLNLLPINEKVLEIPEKDPLVQEGVKYKVPMKHGKICRSAHASERRRKSSGGETK